jgi:hypothetical protein
MIFSLENKGKGQVITEKDQELTGKDLIIIGKDQELARKDLIIIGKDKELARKDLIIIGKDKELALKDVILALTKDKLAGANIKYIVALGDMSMRGIVESLEKESIYQVTKLNMRKNASSDNEYPDSRRLVWQAILNNPETSPRFHNLKKLAVEEKINVVETLISLHRISSKCISKAMFDRVLIDLDSLSRNEVSCESDLMCAWLHQ